MSKLLTTQMLIAADGASIGSGRLIPTIAALVGLVGMVLGGLALARSARHRASSRPFGAIASGIAGVASAAVGGIHAANAAGGVGTGNGLAGAIGAIVMGSISMILGGVALARFHRMRPDSRPPV